jgi:hypothetical protein
LSEPRSHGALIAKAALVAVLGVFLVAESVYFLALPFEARAIQYSRGSLDVRAVDCSSAIVSQTQYGDVKVEDLALHAILKSVDIQVAAPLTDVHVDYYAEALRQIGAPRDLEAKASHEERLSECGKKARRKLTYFFGVDAAVGVVVGLPILFVRRRARRAAGPQTLEAPR